MLELGVVQHVVGHVVTDAVLSENLHHRVAEATMGLLQCPLEEDHHLLVKDKSRCSDELLPPSGQGPAGHRHRAQGPTPVVF